MLWQRIKYRKSGSFLFENKENNLNFYAKVYYPFGSPMVGRGWEAGNTGDYRFGFNGKEKDDEVNVDGGTIAFEMRIYDSRLCRFFSTDPLEADYAYQSTYVFAHNNPIKLVDYMGMGDPPYTVKEGDSPSSIADAKDLTLEQLASNPNNKNIFKNYDPKNKDYWNWENRANWQINPGDQLDVSANGTAENSSDEPVNTSLSFETFKKGTTYNDATTVTTTIPTETYYSSFALTLSIRGVNKVNPLVRAIGAGAALSIATLSLYDRVHPVTRTDVFVTPRTADIDVTRLRFNATLWYCTYTKYNSGLDKYYVGRTCGYGAGPQSVVDLRDIGHEWTNLGYGKAVLDLPIPATTNFALRAMDPSYWSIRGREQLMIERYRAMGKGAPQINGISPNNPNKDLFINAGKKLF